MMYAVKWAIVVQTPPRFEGTHALHLYRGSLEVDAANACECTGKAVAWFSAVAPAIYGGPVVAVRMRVERAPEATAEQILPTREAEAQLV